MAGCWFLFVPGDLWWGVEIPPTSGHGGLEPVSSKDNEVCKDAHTRLPGASPEAAWGRHGADPELSLGTLLRLEARSASEHCIGNYQDAGTDTRKPDWLTTLALISRTSN